METLMIRLYLVFFIITATAVNSHPPPVLAKPEFRQIDVWVGKPCNYSVYTRFFTQLHKKPNSSLIRFIMEGTFLYDAEDVEEEPKRYFDFLDELCIVIREDKFVDPYNFDCINQEDSHSANSPLGEVCTCGTEMEQVDPNVHDPKVNSSSYEEIVLYKTIGLHRLLRVEGRECVSGLNGHCNETLPIPLKCSSGFTCRNLKEANKGKELINHKTHAVYGKCRDDSVQSDLSSDEAGEGRGRSGVISGGNNGMQLDLIARVCIFILPILLRSAFVPVEFSSIAFNYK